MSEKDISQEESDYLQGLEEGIKIGRTVFSAENERLRARIEELEAGLQLLQDGWVKNEIPAGTWAKVRALLNKEKKE